MGNLKLFISTLSFLFLLSATATCYIYKKAVSTTQNIETEELYTQTSFLGTIGIPNEGNHSIRSSPTRCSTIIEADSLKFSVQIEGKNNQVVVNGKKMETDTSSTQKKNVIRVSGEGNSIDIKQTNGKSEVKVKQKGSNNEVKIIQSN
ncbi:MAG: hypothetical protein PHS59_00690 [Paludibacter sp.]|nr:hypothetical protein [Paludibacter sp.]